MDHDIIGAINGHADKRRALRHRLGCREQGGACRPPDRTPGQRLTLAAEAFVAVGGSQ